MDAAVADTVAHPSRARRGSRLVDCQNNGIVPGKSRRGLPLRAGVAADGRREAVRDNRAGVVYRLHRLRSLRASFAEARLSNMYVGLMHSRERALALWQEHGPLLRRWMVASALAVFAVWGTWKYFSMPTTLRIAVGPAGSERELFVRKLAQTLVEAGKPVRLRIVPVTDSAEAAKLLDADKVQLAVVRSDESAIGDARTLSILDRRAVLLVTRGPAKEVASTIATPLAADTLSGKRIVVASDQLGSNRALVIRLLAHSGLDATMPLSEHPAAQIARELADGRADAAALVVDPAAASTRALLADLSKALGGNMILASPPAPEALVAIHRDLALVHLPQGLFGGVRSQPADKLTTVAITEEIVSDSEFSEATATLLFKALLESRGRLPAFRTTYEIETPPQDSLRRFMPHSGVALAIADKSTTFFETYSDQIWLGLFALGLIGSSLAGLGASLGLWKGDGPSPHVKEMRRLVESLERASTLPEIDALRRRLRETAMAQLRETAAAGEAGAVAVDGTHPAHWYELADALARSRRDEMAGQ